MVRQLTQDIITIASYAVVYTVSTLAKHLGTMDWKECSNVVPPRSLKWLYIGFYFTYL